MSINLTIAEWAGYCYYPDTEAAIPWEAIEIYSKYRESAPVDGSLSPAGELKRWIDAGADGTEYILICPWRPDSDITLWHSTLFPLIEERQLMRQFGIELDMIIERVGDGLWEHIWNAITATPAQLAESLVRVIKGTR